MKILLLADINSPHTQKWALSFKQNGIYVGIFSITSPNKDNVWYSSDIEIFYSKRSKSTLSAKTSFHKLTYLTLIPYLKNVIKTFQPDIINAHYASSYGLLATFSGFSKLVLSVWGSDIMIFPKKSFLHKKIIQFVFRKASVICATSNILEKEISAYTSKKVIVIPFGIDTEFFKPAPVRENMIFTVGTAKSLEKIYGIDHVIKAFASLTKKYQEKKMRLLIVGNGSQRTQLENLVDKLKIREVTEFKGRCPVADMPNLYNQMNVLVNVSHNESFGVSVLEASSCEICVVATNIGGLKEVVEHNKTGFLINNENIEHNLYNVLEYIINNQEVCNSMGKNGRQKVLNEYNLISCTEKYLKIFNKLIY